MAKGTTPPDLSDPAYYVGKFTNAHGESAVPEPESFDVVVVGSGGGALTAAIRAHALGLRPVVLEKTATIGGTTAYSGGLAWIAANPLMREEGVEDSIEAAIEYLDVLAGDADPPSFRRRRVAYVEEGTRMVDFLRGQGLEFIRVAGYPDYYPELPGGCREGRALGQEWFDRRRLGEWKKHLRRGALGPGRLLIRGDEVSDLTLALRSAAGFSTLVRVVLRSASALARGASPAASGEALIGRLLETALRCGIPIRRESPVTRLLVEDGRVTGVVVVRDGIETPIAAERGVLLACGGYAHNDAMRARYARQPSKSEWTMANEGETGEMVEAAIELGAATARIEEAWYGPMSIAPDGKMVVHIADRAKPHSIIVDSGGSRFANEAANYHHFGREMYRRNASVPAIPSWLIVDANHRRRYPFAAQRPGRTPREWLTSGYMKKAGTLAELATACGMDPLTLAHTVERFNAFARCGNDEDFQRGESAYDTYYSDPTVGPNPSLGEIGRPPFYAVAVYPGDFGTVGGLVTNEHAQVMREDGSAIQGLYAAGNIAAPLAAGLYFGAGASVGPSMTFGYIAASDCARVRSAI